MRPQWSPFPFFFPPSPAAPSSVFDAALLALSLFTPGRDCVSRCFGCRQKTTITTTSIRIAVRHLPFPLALLYSSKGARPGLLLLLFFPLCYFCCLFVLS
ncbi:unnamed protein product [Polarella glacialis]|uniref:Uncharacterized protein n=1 Tax=Polarella glacialis TaxID=89957 RepID=A0A813DY46_POLGL|nr:unnamed protein product [Polarella glacialis]